MPAQYLLLTFDVEDWFQVENFRPWRPYSTWDSCQMRVEKNTFRILDLLDSLPKTKSKPIKATFFVLGWVAERLPGLVREINSRGHEVASHGYNHIMCTAQDDDQIRKDLVDSKKLLEDLTGTQVKGYRAPSFAISQNILPMIRKAGYVYDSSYNSSNWNSRYGQVDLSACPLKQLALIIDENFFELPISNLRIGKNIIPVGGGGYFRLLPFLLFKKGVTRILDKDQAYLFYLHPWEIDVHQPRVREADFKSRFRHYLNLDKTEHRFRQLIESFSCLRFVSCRQYLQELELLNQNRTMGQL